MKERIALLFSLSWLKQILSVLNPRIKGRVYIGNGSYLKLMKNAALTVSSGSLFINRKWFSNDPNVSHIVIADNARLIVESDFLVYSGARIYVNEGACLKIGNGYFNHNVNINCYERIEIGKNVLIAENVNIRDSDNKYILTGNEEADKDAASRKTQPIKIGDNVWIGSNVTILKGVTIGDGAIIAAGSIVNKNVAAQTLVGGVPARTLKENIKWI